MELSDAEKELKESLSKCRCCLRVIVSSRGAVQIDEKIQNQFFLLTNMNLIQSDCFSTRICQLCASDLQGFADLRNDLVTKQASLYTLAGFDQEDPATNESAEEVHEDDDVEEEEMCNDYEMDYETGPEYENENDMLEEIVEESEYAIEEVESSDTVLKIERIEQKVIQSSDDLQESDYYGESDSKIMYESVSKGEFKEVEIDCEVCGIAIIQSHMEEHVEIMHTDCYMACEKCDREFQSKIALRKHFNEEHCVGTDKRSKKRKLHYCSLCSKEYDYKKQLIDHFRSFHKKERNSECHICQRRFYHRDLKKHIEHVHGEKKVSCEVCGKMYSCYDNLKLHMRYHSVPQFDCNVEGCGKRFHQKTLLDHHKLKHGDKKQVECSECSSSFFTTRDLKRHVQRVHEKVYRQCAVCEMTFCRKDKYREHVLKSHKSLSEKERDAIIEEIKQLKWYDSSA